ncbi:MAG: DUF421 domain-containing protein [Actinomycetota bacterium]|nr:DUF421 domain-containing protein [Actinomycetota bacterium]
MIKTELATSWTSVWLVVVSTLGIFAAVVTYTRIVGLRSFSKMSSFDFAITVAIGSLMATVALSNSSLLDGLVALATLYGIQFVLALGRRHHQVSKVVDNQPLVLMAGRRMLEDNLRKARVTGDDVRAKLREANVYNYDSIRAVVLETTGDISVLHGEGELDLDIFQNVFDNEELEKEEAGGGVRSG